MSEKVLIVDDDVQTLRLVGLMLERQGYKIVAANNGAQALQMAHAEKPDVIVLDIMMPDIDGLEVARRLRKDTETNKIPILMFTAKGQVDDKVTGYEAGADDYLTKPIHPAELSAHLRALLSRSKPHNNEPARERGYMVGMLAAKGGLGVSTMTLNLAIAYHQKTRQEVIAAEMRSGQGSWGIELGNNLYEGLSNLLKMRPQEISTSSIENELARLPYGVRLLMASSRTKDVAYGSAGEQFAAILENLPLLSKLVLLDIGTNCSAHYDLLLERCNEVIVVTEPFPATAQRTRLLIDDLNNKGYGRAKHITVVSNQRIRADVQLTIKQMQEAIGLPIAQVIPPAPETAFQAATRNVPLIQVQIGGVIGQQYSRLADQLAERVQA